MLNCCSLSPFDPICTCQYLPAAFALSTRTCLAGRSGHLPILRLYQWSWTSGNKSSTVKEAGWKDMNRFQQMLGFYADELLFWTYMTYDSYWFMILKMTWAICRQIGSTGFFVAWSCSCADHELYEKSKRFTMIHTYIYSIYIIKYIYIYYM